MSVVVVVELVVVVDVLDAVVVVVAEVEVVVPAEVLEVLASVVEDVEVVEVVVGKVDGTAAKVTLLEKLSAVVPNAVRASCWASVTNERSEVSPAELIAVSSASCNAVATVFRLALVALSAAFSVAGLAAPATAPMAA